MRRAFRYLLPGCALIALLAGCGKKEEQVVTLTPAVDPVAVSEPQPEEPKTGEAEMNEPEESGSETDAPAERASDTGAEEMTVEDLLAQDYMVCFANLTGQDIVKLQISFNIGDIQNLEVLGEKRLYDGGQFSYKNSMPESFRGATRLKMSVTATARDATVMLFPEIDVLDPAHTDVVLTSSAEGWRMYLQ